MEAASCTVVLNWYFWDFMASTLVLFTLNIQAGDLFPVEGRIWVYNYLTLDEGLQGPFQFPNSVSYYCKVTER